MWSLFLALKLGGAYSIATNFRCLFYCISTRLALKRRCLFQRNTLYVQPDNSTLPTLTHKTLFAACAQRHSCLPFSSTELFKECSLLMCILQACCHICIVATCLLCAMERMIRSSRVCACVCKYKSKCNLVDISDMFSSFACSKAGKVGKGGGIRDGGCGGGPGGFWGDSPRRRWQ